MRQTEQTTRRQSKKTSIVSHFHFFGLDFQRKSWGWCPPHHHLDHHLHLLTLSVSCTLVSHTALGIEGIFLAIPFKNEMSLLPVSLYFLNQCFSLSNFLCQTKQTREQNSHYFFYYYFNDDWSQRWGVGWWWSRRWDRKEHLRVLGTFVAVGPSEFLGFSSTCTLLQTVLTRERGHEWHPVYFIYKWKKKLWIKHKDLSQVLFLSYIFPKKKAMKEILSLRVHKQGNLFNLLLVN